MELQTGDAVKHKKDKSLERGRVLEFAASGVRARVYWDKKFNPRLLWNVSAYYRLDLLELIKDGDSLG